MIMDPLTDVDGCFINWNETLYIPESHLITEDEFNKHSKSMSYKEYFQLFSQQTTIPSNDEKQTDNKQPVKAVNHTLADGHTDQRLKLETSRLHGHTDQRLKLEISRLHGHTDQRLKLETSGLHVNKTATKIELREPSSNQTLGIFENHSFNHTRYHMLVPQPNYSNITVSDRQYYKRYLKNRKKANYKFKQEEDIKFQEVCVRIQQEQHKYQTFLSMAAQRNLEEYLYMNPVVSKLVQENIKETMREAVLLYKECYQMDRSIGYDQLFTHDNTNGNLLSMNFHTRLVEQAEKSMVHIPNDGHKLHVENNIRMNTDKVQHPQLDDLIKKENIDVYVSHETFLVIMQSFIDNSCELIIPFKVNAEISPSPESLGKKAITFSGPLPTTRLSSREANFIYYKSNLLKQSSQKKDESLNLYLLEGLKILVESCVDSYVNNNETYKINPKVEYQSAVGMEQYSLIELCRFWWDSFLANTEYMLCVRLDPRTNIVLRTDRYTRDELCPPSCPYNPNIYITQFHNLVRELLQLDSGKYALEKSTSQSSFSIFKESNVTERKLTSKFTNILDNNINLLTNEGTSLWLPIDMNILPNKMNEFEIPWLFELKRMNKSMRKREKNLKRRKAAKTTEKFRKSFNHTTTYEDDLELF